MVLAPGSGGSAGSAMGPSYLDKTVNSKAHDKHWPEVDKCNVKALTGPLFDELYGEDCRM